MLEQLLQWQSLCTCSSGLNTSVDNSKQEQCTAAVRHNVLGEVVSKALVAQIERQQLFVRGLRSILLQKTILKSVGKSIEDEDKRHPIGFENQTMSRQQIHINREVPVVDWLVRIISVSICLRQPYRSSIMDQVRTQLGAPMAMIRFETAPRNCIATNLQPEQHQQIRQWLVQLIKVTMTQTTRIESRALDLSLGQHWHWESKLTDENELDAHSSLDVSTTHPLHQPLLPDARHQLPVTETKSPQVVSKVGTGRLALRPHDRPDDPLVQLRNSSHPLVSPPPAVMLGVHELDGTSVRTE